MKEKLELSWRENGKMRGIMKSLGVKMSGEAKMRELVNKIIIDFVVSTSVCFVFMEKRGKQKIPYHDTATLAYIQDVEGLLRNLLDAYSRLPRCSRGTTGPSLTTRYGSRSGATTAKNL